MPHKKLPASGFEGAQIKRGRVVDSSRPSQRRGIAIEVECECVRVFSYFFVRQIFFVLSGEFQVGKPRCNAGTWRAKVVPTRPHGLGPRNVRIRVSTLPLELVTGVIKRFTADT